MIKNSLAILMAEHGIKTMIELSKQTGLDKNTISNWYNQKATRFSSETLDTICKFFDCQIGDLLTYLPDENNE